MIDAYSIGLSAMSVGRRNLELIGQNIANATTPGYHRQQANLVSTVTLGNQGTGVDVATITRYDASPVRTAILQGNADNARAEAGQVVQQQVETALNSGQGGVGDSLNGLFNQFTQLTARPDDTAVRQTVVSTAATLAGKINDAGTQVDKLRSDLRGQVEQSVNQINEYTKQIADYNVRIANGTGLGQSVNDLVDQRDQVINNLSQLVDLRTVSQPLNVVNVLGTGGPFVVSDSPLQFQTVANSSGGLDIVQTGTTTPVSFSSGKLAGQLDQYNTQIPAQRTRLDTLANTLIAQTNQVNATGVPLSGPYTSLSGSVSVNDPNAPLATAGSPFPIQAGALTISVTDSTGNRTNATIAYDPAIDSLNSIAANITTASGGNVTASVDPVTNRLNLTAASGFSFDFAGRDTVPPSANAVANPDTGNLLSGVGIGGLFAGFNAVGIKVDAAVAADPRLLGGSASGQAGDASNFSKLVAVRDKTVISGRTLSGEFTDLAAAVGTNIKQLGDVQSSHAGILQNLTGQEQSVVGVDTNEEMLNLLNYQRMVQSATQYISVVNTALDAVLSIIK